jgi:hypothetical protein
MRCGLPRACLSKQPVSTNQPCLKHQLVGSTSVVGELITLPLRAGIRAIQLWLRATGEAVELALRLAERALDRREGTGGGYAGPTTTAEPVLAARPPALVVHEASAGTTSTRPETSRPETPPAPREPEPGVAPEEPAPPSVAPELAQPEHVSEEPELVEAFSEPGAEEGAGAEVHVQEPWEGYERANVKEIVARLQTATPAELGAVQLYERGHRGRQTVLAAVERQLRTANGGGSPRSERNR